ncbi:MAG: HlyD family efflux transporter periplasmic adaptor subunit [Victivallales bacterium]
MLNVHNNPEDPSRSGPASASRPVSMPLPPQQQFTGELRGDLELFKGGTDEGGLRTWVIFDPVSGNYFRISEKDYRIISCMSGNLELESFIDKLKKSGIQTDKAETSRIIAFLQQSNLMKPVYKATEVKAQRTREMKKKMFWHLVLAMYLFFRIPLISPDRFIQNTLEIARSIFNRWTMMVLKIVAAIGYICLVVNYHKFADAFLASISIQGLLRYSIAIVLIKAIHEFAHAYTARNFGCRVRKMGVAFIVFFPRFYTDITDSWRIPERGRRFLIDGAGIISELFIGGFAALIWANTSTGPANTIAYYIFTVTLINTAMVNGNPFIRYDGYYMLMDLVNIDNLQKRGTELLRGIWRKYLFGLAVTPDPSTGWKRIFLVAYSISSFLYRIFLYTSIILIVYFNFTKVVGIVLLILEVWLLLVKPILDEGKFFVKNWNSFNRRKLAYSLGGTAFIVILLIIPLPWRITAPCEIKPVESVTVYATINGFLEDMPLADGASVHKGDTVLTQKDPVLEMRSSEAKLDTQIAALQFEQAQTDKEQLSQINVRKESLEYSRTAQAEAERRTSQMRTTSPVDGVFSLHDPHLKNGKWLSKGDIVGEIFRPGAMRAIAYVPEDDVKFIHAGERVSVSLSDALSSYPGKVTGINPLPAALPPSPLLSVFGGPIPGFMGEDGFFKPVLTYYQIDMEFTAAPPTVGRTGIAKLSKYSSVAGNLVKKTIQVLQRELSF